VPKKLCSEETVKVKSYYIYSYKVRIQDLDVSVGFPDTLRYYEIYFILTPILAEPKDVEVLR
jgi:hypothetical protein